MNVSPGPFDASGGRVARLRFGTPEYQVIEPGTHVLCAVTGRAVALEELRYWSVERQEAYADAAASFEAERAARGG